MSVTNIVVSAVPVSGPNDEFRICIKCAKLEYEFKYCFRFSSIVLKLKGIRCLSM